MSNKCNGNCKDCQQKADVQSTKSEHDSILDSVEKMRGIRNQNREQKKGVDKMNMTKEDMIELRKQMAISQNKSKYGYLNTGDIAQKKYKMRKDPLSKENRKRIDDIKDKLNGEHVESDLW